VVAIVRFRNNKSLMLACPVCLHQTDSIKFPVFIVLAALDNALQ
jgi:hypothetical protein